MDLVLCKCSCQDSRFDQNPTRARCLATYAILQSSLPLVDSYLWTLQPESAAFIGEPDHLVLFVAVDRKLICCVAIEGEGGDGAVDGFYYGHVGVYASAALQRTHLKPSYDIRNYSAYYQDNGNDS